MSELRGGILHTPTVLSGACVLRGGVSCCRAAADSASSSSSSSGIYRGACGSPGRRAVTACATEGREEPRGGSLFPAGAQGEIPGGGGIQWTMDTFGQGCRRYSTGGLRGCGSPGSYRARCRRIRWPDWWGPWNSGADGESSVCCVWTGRRRAGANGGQTFWGAYPSAA